MKIDQIDESIGNVRDLWRLGKQTGSQAAQGSLLDLFGKSDFLDSKGTASQSDVENLKTIISKLTFYQRKKLLVLLQRMHDADNKKTNLKSKNNVSPVPLPKP